MWTGKSFTGEEIKPMRNSHRDPVTHSKIMKHLADINDRITDEDIRNIRIGIQPIREQEPGNTIAENIKEQSRLRPK